MGKRRRDDRGIVDLLGKTLVKQVAVGAPNLQGGLHGWSGNGEVIKADGGLVRLKLPGHQSRTGRIGGHPDLRKANCS